MSKSWTALAVIISLVVAALIYSFATEKPQTRITVINTTPDNLANAIFYQKVFNKQQMNTRFTYLITTDKEIDFPAFKKNHPETIVYQGHAGDGNKISEIFSNDFLPEFAGAPITTQ